MKTAASGRVFFGLDALEMKRPCVAVCLEALEVKIGAEVLHVKIKAEALHVKIHIFFSFLKPAEMMAGSFRPFGFSCRA